LSSRAISFSTESSWLRLSRSSFPQVLGPDIVSPVSAAEATDEFISAEFEVAGFSNREYTAA
jgi:hypothetical protein